MSNSNPISVRLFTDLNFENMESLQLFLTEHSSSRTIAIDDANGELVSYDIEEQGVLEAVELLDDGENRPIKL